MFALFMISFFTKNRQTIMADKTNSLSISSTDLFNELSQLIEQSKLQVAVQANSAVTILFWQVGNRINQDILQNKRADYAKTNCVDTVDTIERTIR